MFVKKHKNTRIKTSPNDPIQDSIKYTISQNHSINLDKDTGITITQNSSMNF